MEKKLAVWYRPGRPATLVGIVPTLENLQKAVGGRIQMVDLPPQREGASHLTLVCNEAGKLIPNNQITLILKNKEDKVYDFVFGPCLLLGRMATNADGENEPVNLTDKDRQYIVREYGRGDVEDEEKKETEDEKARRERRAADCRRMYCRLAGNRSRHR